MIRLIRCASILALLTCAVPVPARTQATNDRVRVHLLGVRIVDDSVARLDRDSLFLRQHPAIARREVTGIDVWRPRSFARTTFLYGNAVLAVLQLVDVESHKDRPNYGVPRNVGTHIAISAGAGLGAALVERWRRRGRWVPALVVSP